MNKIRTGIILISFGSIVIILTLIIILIADGFTLGKPVDMESTGQFGDYFGGVIGTIVSAAAFWLLYLTLRNQINTESKTSFDSQFSKMLTIRQQNLTNMSFDASKLKPDADQLYIEPKEYNGAEVFKIFFFQFITCKNELRPLLAKRDKIYTSDYESKVRNIPLVMERGIDIYHLAKIDISYSIVFYGVDSDGSRILRSIFKERYKDTLVDKIIKYLSLKPAYDKEIYKRWLRFKSFSSPQNLIKHIYDVYYWRENQTHNGFRPEFPDLSVGYRSNFVKYYCGFHNVLGHYMRQNYQLIKYVDGNIELSQAKKYELIKLIRCQMSSYEQIVLFLNSLSVMGRSWELVPENHDNLIRQKQLITHYKLIKNIPIQLLFGIDIKEFYPNISYELF